MSKALLVKTNILVSVKESHLLKSEMIERLIQSTDFDETIQILSETVYADYFKGEEVLDLEKVMEQIRRDQLTEAYSEAEEMPILVDLFAAFGLFHNLKCGLKESVVGVPLRENYLEGSRYSTQAIETLVKTKTASDLPVELQTASLEALKDYEKHQNLKRLEIIVDSYYFAYLSRLAKETEDKTIQSFVENYIDCYNISVLLQLPKNAESLGELTFVENGKQSKSNLLALQKETKEGIAQYFSNTEYRFIWEETEDGKNMESFDLIVDNFLIKKAITCKIQPFGVLPFVGFVFAKLIEIKNLRIILLAKRSGLEPAKIEKRMRIRYEL